jgi:DNA-directed RNA polymerase delta subunit
MFNSPKLPRKSMDLIVTKHLLEEKCQTIEQLKTVIDELKFRHEKKEQELIKHIGILYRDLQQNKKKMAHLIFKYQKQKKVNNSNDSI